MIENLKGLSVYDKLTMITKSESFSEATKSHINFYKSEWMKQIHEKISDQEINVYNSDNVIEWNECYHLGDRKDIPLEFRTLVKRFFMDLSKMPCETKDNITEILLFYGTVLDKIVNDAKLAINHKQYIHDFISIFFLKALQNKLEAHRVYLYSITELMSGNPNDQTFYFNNFGILVEEFVAKTSDIYSSIVIYMMLQYLHKEHNKRLVDILINTKRFLSCGSYDDIRFFLSELEDGGIDALALIDKVEEKELPKSNREVSSHTFGFWSEKIIDNTKHALTENYTKNKLCDVTNYGGLVIGDNVFDDDMTVNELIIEMEKLSTDTVIDYIGEKTTIDFNMDKNVIGYMKVRENIPLCKVLLPKHGFRTVINKDGVKYVLFKKYGDKTIYGISFPAGFKGIRKWISFEIPDGLEYNLSI